MEKNSDWPGLPYLRKRSEKTFLDAQDNKVLAFFELGKPQTGLGSLIYALALKRDGQKFKAGLEARIEENPKKIENKHKKFFTEELLNWKREIIKANNLGNLLNSSDDNVSSADMVDQASSYTDKTVEMKALNRSRKLISKINSALQRLKEGTYGFCEETGEPIGLKRLMARPVATLSIEAQEKHERDEKIFVDD